MANTKQQKQVVIERYNTLLTKYKNIILIDIKDIKTKDIENFKNELEDSVFLLAKNTLLEKVLNDFEIKLTDENFVGRLAVTFTNDEFSKVIKSLVKLADLTKQIEVRRSYIEGKTFTSTETISFKDIGTKEELISKLLGMLNYPTQGLVNVLNSNIQKLVFVLNIIANKNTVEEVTK